LALAPAAAATIPATVTVPADQTSATFTYTDAGTTASATLTATLGASSLAATVSAVLGHPVLNEVDYDQPGTDTAEFVEIYNPTRAPLPLATLALVFVNGAPNAEYRRVALPPGTPTGMLAPGQFLVVASATVAVPAGTPVILFSGASNNIQNGDP